MKRRKSFGPSQEKFLGVLREAMMGVLAMYPNEGLFSENNREAIVSVPRLELRIEMVKPSELTPDKRTVLRVWTGDGRITVLMGSGGKLNLTVEAHVETNINSILALFQAEPLARLKNLLPA